MKRHLMPTTIRGKVIACTGAITLGIAAVTVTICFLVFQTFLRRNQLQSAEYNLQVVSSNVGTEMEKIIYFNNWCLSSNDLTRYLEAFKDKQRMPPIHSKDAALRTTALRTYERLREEYNNTSSSNYITQVIISPLNCRNYLQILSDTATAVTPKVALNVHDSAFFAPLYEAGDYHWIGLMEPMFSISEERVIPLVRPMSNQYNTIIGWSYMAVSDRVIRDYLTAFPMQPDSYLYISVGGKDYLLSDGHFEEAALQHTVLSRIDDGSLNPETQSNIIRMADGSRRRMVTCPLGVEGWTISVILSEQDYNAQTQTYLMIILGIVVAIACMGLFLALILNRTISQPVRRLRDRITRISGGDFSRDETIEGEDELGTIGRGINSMSENVKTLMEHRVEDEKQKNDLEYQILQSQINPHFLYNTLNSIKWMATIQNAPGIAEMVTSLARLMKNVSKGTAVQITLDEELALVKDYMLIQQYRYGGSLTVDYIIEAEELGNCLIHRFTLQPLLENALFHGIEPKGCAGKITIRAIKAMDDAQDAVLKVSVTDNGIGMDQETIDRVLRGDNQSNADFFRHLGIGNVNKRIHYEFGPEYGISIESVPGEYTTMMITLPYQVSDKGEKL